MQNWLSAFRHYKRLINPELVQFIIQLVQPRITYKTRTRTLDSSSRSKFFLFIILSLLMIEHIIL